jgi:hypothetical protein
MCYSLLQQKQKTRSLRRGKLKEDGPAAKDNSPFKATSALFCCQVGLRSVFAADPHPFCLAILSGERGAFLPTDCKNGAIVCLTLSDRDTRMNYRNAEENQSQLS